MVTPHHRTTRRYALILGTAALLCLSATATASGTANHGTVKVQEDSETGDHSNNPHVGCSFSVEGFKMAADAGTITIKAWPPEGDHETVVLSDNWTADEGDSADDKDGAHFVAGPYELESGHYKVFASNAPDHDKTKVFWVDCEQAEIPVFPTPMALGLAGVGALGGTWVVLRRKP